MQLACHHLDAQLHNHGDDILEIEISEQFIVAHI